MLLYVRAFAADHVGYEARARPIQEPAQFAGYVYSLWNKHFCLIDVEGIHARVERAVAENPDISVIVQAHPQARNQLVIHSVDQSRSAGVQNVGFAVEGDGLL